LIRKIFSADMRLFFKGTPPHQRDTVVGTEFVGTSISSGGDGADTNATVQRQLPENPHIKFHNARRGYVLCNITREQWQTDYRIVAAVTRPDEPISTRASFVVENGAPGAIRTA
jgi:alkaline phosphatase D